MATNEDSNEATWGSCTSRILACGVTTLPVRLRAWRSGLFALLFATLLGNCTAEMEDHDDVPANLADFDSGSLNNGADLVVSSIEIPPETDPGTVLWFIPVDEPGTIPPAALVDGRVALIDAGGTIRLVNAGGKIVYEVGLSTYVGPSGTITLTPPVGGPGFAVVGASFHDRGVTCDYGGALLTIPIENGQDLPVLDGTPEIFGPPALLNEQTVWSTVGYQWNQFGDLCAKGIVLSAALAKVGKSVLVPAPARGVSFANDGSLRIVHDPDVVAAYSADLKRLWTTTLDGLGIGEPALFGDGSCAVTLGKRLVTLDGEGNVVWDTTWSASVSKLVGQAAIGVDGTVFVPATSQGGGSKPNAPAIVAATADGEELWTFVGQDTKIALPSGVTCGTPVVGSGGTVFAACGNGTLVALDQKNRSVSWAVENVATATSPVLLPNGVLIVTGVDGYRGVYVGPETLQAGTWARYRGNNQSTGALQ